MDISGSKRTVRCGLVIVKGCREVALVALSLVTTCCAFVSPIVRSAPPSVCQQYTATFSTHWLPTDDLRTFWRHERRGVSRLGLLRAQGQQMEDAATAAGKAGAPKVVVVGAGFAGLGAAHHLSKQGYNVTLLDAAAQPGGIIRDRNGNSIEAGVKGFWYQYKNIFALLNELGLPTAGAGSVLSDWSTSSFFSDKGREVDSVVFQRKLLLPTPLGQFVHTLPTFQRLSVGDRLSLWRLAFALIEYQEEYEKYDSMSIADLFKSSGVSQQLYRDFLEPLLLAMLFAPPESLSAAVIIGTFDFLALGHQANFDVKWCRGPIGEKLLSPLVAAITGTGGSVLGAHTVVDLEVSGATGDVTRVLAKKKTQDGDVLTAFEADAVVIAVGVKGAQTLTRLVPALGKHDHFRRILNLRASDCMAVRLTLDRRYATRSPANVMIVPQAAGGAGGVAGGEVGVYRDVGATFFNLNELHSHLKHPSIPTVIEVDLYHTAALLPLADDAVTKLALGALRNAEPSLSVASVAESIVMRAPQCATIFSPGSFRNRPKQVTPIPNVFLAGDYVRETPMHGADGLSQERALVTGLKAANLVVQKLGLGSPAAILDVEKDEPHIDAAKKLRRLFKTLGLPVPFSL